MSRLAASLFLAWLVLSSGTSAKAAGTDESKLSFDTLDGWHIRPYPAVQLARLGVTRASAAPGQHLDFTLDVLQGIGLGVSFSPPKRPFRSYVYDAQGNIRQEQWLGFSIISILKGGSVSTGQNLLSGAEIGFGGSIDVLQVLSLGGGVDLYRGISVGGQLFHTGLLPAAYGAGHFTREDIFVSLSLNLSTTLFGGSSGGGSGGGSQ